MYRKNDNKLTINEFMLPRDEIEGEYADLFPSDTGTVAKPARIAFGATIIKETLGLTDEEKVEQVRQNPHLQLFLGYTEYSTKKPFDPSLMDFFHIRDNIKYCQARGIRLSGPRLGRPPKEADKVLKKLSRQDELDRIAIEDKFGEGKRRYGLDLIKEKLQETSETTIMINLIVMNLARGYRDFFVFFSKSVLSSFETCFYTSPGGLPPLRLRVLGKRVIKDVPIKSGCFSLGL